MTNRQGMTRTSHELLSGSAAMTVAGGDLVEEARRRLGEQDAEVVLAWLSSLGEESRDAARRAEAGVWLQLGMKPEALEALRSLVFRPGRVDSTVLAEFAELAVELFALDEARMIYRELLFRPEGSRTAALGLWKLESLAAHPRHRHVVRTEALRIGLLLEPSDAVLWYELGAFETKRSSWQLAERSLRRCLSSFVGEARFWRRLASCSAMLGKQPAAAAALRRAIVIESAADAGAWQSACETLLALREPGPALRAYRIAAMLHGAALVGKKRAALDALKAAIGAVYEDSDRRARMHELRRRLVAEPQDAVARLHLAQCAVAAGKRKLTNRLSRQLVVFPALLAKRARLSMAMQDPVLSGRAARTLLAHDPGDPDSLLELSREALRADDGEQAARWSRALLCVTQMTGYLQGASAVLGMIGRPEAAIPVICRAAAAAPRDGALRMELARLVGTTVRQMHPHVQGASAAAPRIIDCFPFNNEHDLLTARLELLYSHVDRFVLVEAPCTFTGMPKPLHFAESRDRYARYLDKITHVVVEQPSIMTEPWARDFFQRDSLVRGLNGYAAPEDFVVVADVDEFWDPTVVRRFSGEYAALRMRLAQGKVNHRPIFGKKVAYDTGAICRFRVLRAISPSLLRFETVREWSKAKGEWIDDAGWHLTSVGDLAFVQGKLASYAHQEPTKRRRFTEAVIGDRMQRLSDGIPDEDWVLFDRDRRWPKPVRKALARASLWQAPRADMLSAAVFDVTDAIDRVVGRRAGGGGDAMQRVRAGGAIQATEAEGSPRSALSRLADDPGDKAARLDAVAGLWEADRLEAADRLLDAGLRRNPLDPDLTALKGFLCLRDGRASQAADWLRKTLVLSPAHSKVRRRLVMSLDRLAQMAPAETELARLMVNDPGHTEFARDMRARWGRG